MSDTHRHFVKPRFERFARARALLRHGNAPAFWCCLLLAAVALLPRLILGSDSYFTIHDNLDANVATAVVMAKSGGLFHESGVFDQFVGGQPRGFLPGAYNLTLWLFLLLSPFAALVVNELLVRLIAFWGMYLLVDTWILSGKNRTIAIGVALCFSLLPFYTIYGLSIAGQPLLYYAFLNLWFRARVAWSYAIIAGFVLYSSLVFAGVFLIALIGVCFGVAYFRTRELPRPALLGFGLLIAGYIFVEHNLIVTMFFRPEYVSHRSVWQYSPEELSAATLGHALRRAYYHVVIGQYHAAGLHKYIAAFVVAVLGFSLFQRRRFDTRARKTLVAAAVSIGVVFLILTFLYSRPGLVLHQNTLRSFQFTRFHWLVAGLWYIAAAAGLSAIASNRKLRALALVLLVGQLFYVLSNSGEIDRNYRLLKSKATGQASNLVTFREFYDTELFERIGVFIGKPRHEYRIVSIGVHPGVATFNGFYALDGYHSSYLLSHKLRFREVIAMELDKNERWRKNFDEWGNRCYVFASELAGFDNYKDSGSVLRHLQLNTTALKAMGGEYVFSAVPIENAADTGLQLLETFRSERSRWTIHLYRVL